ncbi:MAG: energy transducer TonB [Saprospiraceae bacterium]|nr:energy transducer TonB [Saprospiraceae bacterium]
MINRPTNIPSASRYFYYAIILLIFNCFLWVASAKGNPMDSNFGLNPPDTLLMPEPVDEPEPDEEIKDLITFARPAARFPGCEDIEGTDQEKKACADRKLFDFLYSELKYPNSCIEAGIEGRVFIRFTVETDGSLSNIEVTHTPKGGELLGEEALRVVKKMAALPKPWIPAHWYTESGLKKEASRYILPIKFSLADESEKGAEEEEDICILPAEPDAEIEEEEVYIEDDSEPLPRPEEPVGDDLLPPTINSDSPTKSEETKTEENTPVKEEEPEEIFGRYGETMPRFPGCEHLGNDKERKTCADQKMLDFIYNELQYPQACLADKIEGRVFVQFTVKEDGTLIDIAVVRTPKGGELLGKEALRIVEKMAALPEPWTPGQAGWANNRKNTKVRYTLPINFKLD